MYNILQHAHSGLRWLVLLFLIMAVGNALIKWQGGKSYTAGDKRIGTIALSTVHLQFLLGLILYFISPKVNFSGEAMKEAASRFYLVEHLVGMLVAVALISIGNARVKKAVDDAAKFKTTFTFFLIGLLIILIMIPWPFREALGGSWF